MQQLKSYILPHCHVYRHLKAFDSHLNIPCMSSILQGHVIFPVGKVHQYIYNPK